MSKVKIEGNASGTGTFTIAAPNSNTDRTFNLPDEAGTVLTSGGAIDVDASAPADSIAIDSSGNVGVGTSSPISASNQKSVSINATNYSRLDMMIGGTHTARLTTGSANTSFGTVTSTPLVFVTADTERMRIDGNGHVKRLNVPAFFAQVNQTRNNGAFDAYTIERFDNGGHFNVTNGRFTAPVDGYYQFNGTQNTLSMTVGQWLGITFVVNASTSYAATYNIASTVNDNGISISAVIYLTANDYVTLNAVNQSSIYNSVTFSGHHIG